MLAHATVENRTADNVVMHDVDDVRVLWPVNSDSSAQNSPSGSSNSSSSASVEESMPDLTLSPQHSHDGTHSLHHGLSRQDSDVPCGGCSSNATRMLNRNVQYMWRSCDPNDAEARAPHSASATSSDGPSPRFGHTSVAYNDKMITFGGRNGELFYNDVWAYAFGTHRWGASAWVCGGETITPRCGHTATVCNSKMIVIGGCVGVAAQACVGDVWSLDLDTQTWQCLSQRRSPSTYRDAVTFYFPSNDNTAMTPAVQRRPAQSTRAALPPKKGHTTVNVDNTTLVVFGGSGGTASLDDAIIRCLDLHTNTWCVLHATGQRPEPRMYHSAELTERRTMLVFGGKLPNGNFSNDLYELTLPDVLPTVASPGSSMRGSNHSPHGVWRKINLAAGSVRPSARFCSSSVYVNGTLCIFLGGSDSYHRDSFEFDLSTQEWRALPVTVEGYGLPPCTRPTTVHSGNTITFFGGCTSRHECVNTVMQMGLEVPSLKELCREWVRKRTFFNTQQRSRPGSAPQSATRPPQPIGEPTSAFLNLLPPSDDDVLSQHLPDSLVKYLGSSE